MPRIIVIGASAGGVPALMQLTAALKATVAAPILIVLHTGARDSILPTLLKGRCKLDVGHASHGEALRAGSIRIAPPDYHMLVIDEHIELSRGPKQNHSRPAIDPLFRSAALAHGPGVIGVVLTGRLDDGTAGLQAIKQCGGTTIVQDPADAIEPSMPTSALRHVEVDHCVPLSMMPMLLESLTTVPPEPAPADPSATLQHESDLEQGIGNPIENLRAIARPSPFACPDCHGGLWELLDSRPTRYRCHVGHGYTEQSLRAGLAEKADEAIWNTIRAVEERQLLFEHLAQVQANAGDNEAAEPLRAMADQLKRQVAVLRSIAEHPVNGIE